MLAAELVKLLAGPKCRDELRLTASEEEGLACDSCRLLYAIRPGIPVLLVNAAQGTQ
ncbi:MAG: Trm112 family protein [Desulfobulbaceae bacterium]|nr:Trm112 family protein [Desulfobulbaceae bacterium]